MLVIDESAAGCLDAQGAYFDGSLELLRELAVTSDLDAALPRLSAIVSKMLPHDALRMACFDQRGRRVVNASTGDVPDMMRVRRRRADHRRFAERRGRGIRRPARDGAAGRRRLPLGPGGVDLRPRSSGPRRVLVEAAAGVQSHARAAGATDRIPPRSRSLPQQARHGHPSHRRRPCAAGRPRAYSEASTV